MSYQQIGCCNMTPCQCGQPGCNTAFGIPEFFPPGSQLVKLPEATCSSVTSAAETTTGEAGDEVIVSPGLGKVAAAFIVPNVGESSQFTATNASSFLLAGGWVYFEGLGYLQIASVSGEVVTFVVPPQPHGVNPGTQIIEGACFASLPPITDLPFEFDLAAQLDAICEGAETCNCDPASTRFNSLWGCNDSGNFEQLLPPNTETSPFPVITADADGWKVTTLESLLTEDILRDVVESLSSKQVLLPVSERVKLLEETYDSEGLGAPYNNPLGDLSSGDMNVEIPLTNLGADPTKVTALYLCCFIEAVTTDQSGKLYLEVQGGRVVQVRYLQGFDVDLNAVYIWIPYDQGDEAVVPYAWGWDNSDPNPTIPQGMPNNVDSDDTNGVKVFLLGYQFN